MSETHDNDAVVLRRAAARRIERWYHQKRDILQLRVMQREFRRSGVLCTRAFLTRPCARFAVIHMPELWTVGGLMSSLKGFGSFQQYHYGARLSLDALVALRGAISASHTFVQNIIVNSLLCNRNNDIDEVMRAFHGMEHDRYWDFVATGRDFRLDEIRQYRDHLDLGTMMRYNPHYRPSWLIAFSQSALIDTKRELVRKAADEFVRRETEFEYARTVFGADKGKRVFPNRLGVSVKMRVVQFAHVNPAERMQNDYRAAYIQHKWRARRARRVARVVNEHYDELVADIITSYVSLEYT